MGFLKKFLVNEIYINFLNIDFNLMYLCKVDFLKIIFFMYFYRFYFFLII